MAQLGRGEGREPGSQGERAEVRAGVEQSVCWMIVGCEGWQYTCPIGCNSTPLVCVSFCSKRLQSGL